MSDLLNKDKLLVDIGIALKDIGKRANCAESYTRAYYTGVIAGLTTAKAIIKSGLNIDSAREDYQIYWLQRQRVTGYVRRHRNISQWSRNRFFHRR